MGWTIECNLLRSLAVVLAGMGCLLHGIALSVTYWANVIQGSTGEYEVGLWTDGCVKSCMRIFDYSDLDAYFMATQAFVILALISGIAGMVLPVIGAFISNKKFYMLAFIACIIAVVCLVFAMSIFGGMFADSVPARYSWDWAWGFYMTIGSIILFILSAICNVYLTKTDSNYLV